MQKNFIIFAFTYVSESFVLFYGHFCMNSYSVDSDEALKQGDEALNGHHFNFEDVLDSSSLHRYDFLLSLNHFITITFLRKIIF